MTNVLLKLQKIQLPSKKQNTVWYSNGKSIKILNTVVQVWEIAQNLDLKYPNKQ